MMDGLESEKSRRRDSCDQPPTTHLFILILFHLEMGDDAAISSRDGIKCPDFIIINNEE